MILQFSLLYVTCTSFYYCDLVLLLRQRKFLFPFSCSLNLLVVCNFRIEVDVPLRTFATIFTGIWWRKWNMCWCGVQVRDTIHNIVAFLIFFMMKMWFRLLRKRCGKHLFPLVIWVEVNLLNLNMIALIQNLFDKEFMLALQDFFIFLCFILFLL